MKAELLSALDFVMGKGEIAHLQIHNGRVTSYDMRTCLSLSAPIGIDVNCNPEAERTLKAIQACGEKLSITLADNKKLVIRSKGFQAHIDAIPDLFVGVEPAGAKIVHLPYDFLPALNVIHEIVSNDPARLWASGALFKDKSIFATNNVVMMEYWLGGESFPRPVNIPRFAIRELLRINEHPEGVRLSDNSATFCFSGARWMRTQLIAQDWPEIAPMFEAMPPTKTAIPPTLFDALKKLAPFANGGVYLSQGQICTLPNPGVAAGTAIEVAGLRHVSAFAIPALQLLEGRADVIGFEEWPRPVPFYGKQLRGLIAGLRQ